GRYFFPYTTLFRSASCRELCSSHISSTENRGRGQGLGTRPSDLWPLISDLCRYGPGKESTRKESQKIPRARRQSVAQQDLSKLHRGPLGSQRRRRMDREY